MVMQTTGTRLVEAERVAGPEDILAMQALAREVPVVPAVKEFALALVRGSRPGEEGAVPEAQGLIRLGASPRAAQALLLAGKVLALAHGRRHVAQQDVIDVAKPVMAHRLLLDYRAQAEGRDYRRVLETLIARAQERKVPQVSMWTKELLTTAGNTRDDKEGAP
jgi:MoxR-like ATPase